MIGLLGRAGPLSLLLASLLLLPGGLAIDDLRVGLIALLVLAAVFLMLTGGRGVSGWRLLPGLVAFASITWSNWLLAADRDLENAAVAGLRVAYFALPGIVLAGFIDPSALGDHLGQRLRLPARPVLATVAALQRLDTLGEDWDTLARARRVRGLGPTRSPLSQGRYYGALTFGLLVVALRQAERMTVAMEARGYDRLTEPGHRRTWARPAPWTSADTALLVVAALLAALPALLQVLLQTA